MKNIVVISAFILASSCLAQESKVDCLINKLMDTMYTGSSAVENMKKTMNANNFNITGMQYSENQKTAMADYTNKLLEKFLSDESLAPIKKLLKDNFTEKELESLLDLLKNPIYEKWMQSAPEVARLLSQNMPKITSELQEELNAIMKASIAPAAVEEVKKN